MDLTSVKGMVGGFPPWILLGLGFVTGWLKSFWNFFYDHTFLIVEKKIKVSVTIEEGDHKEAFTWLNCWVEDHLKERRIANLRLQRAKYTTEEEWQKNFSVVPGYGFYYLWWNKKLVTFTSSKKESAGAVGSSDSKLIRTIELTIWGTRDREKILEILIEARNKFLEVNPRKLRYYTHSGDYWDDYPLKERSLDTLYLPETQLKDIVKTITEFHSSDEKYRKLGIPYRLGLLFEGPPGSGKTSLVQALASHLKLKIYYVNLSQLSAPGLGKLLNDCEYPAIVLMEDIDCVEGAKDREEKKDAPVVGSIRTNELLNLLDGLVATEERIVIMTTNHPEKLDKALIRSGRVDRRFHIGYAADEEIKRFCDTARQYYDVPEFSVFRSMLSEKCTIADAQSKLFEIQRKSLDIEVEVC